MVPWRCLKAYKTEVVPRFSVGGRAIAWSDGVGLWLSSSISQYLAHGGMLPTAESCRQQHLTDNSILPTIASCRQQFKPTAALGLILSCVHLEAVQLQGHRLLRKGFVPTRSSFMASSQSRRDHSLYIGLDGHDVGSSIP